MEDGTVKAAMHYWSTGEPPRHFTWLLHDPHILSLNNDTKPNSNAASLDNNIGKVKNKPLLSSKKMTTKNKDAEGQVVFKKRPLVLDRWVTALRFLKHSGSDRLPPSANLQ